MIEKGIEIADAKGKLGIQLVGLDAVSTTFIAGVEAIRRGLSEPIGSLTQMGTIRLGKRTDGRSPLIKDLAEQLVADMLQFTRPTNCSRLLIVWWPSAEASITAGPVHKTLARFEKGLREDSPNTAPSMVYAYAALKLGIPFANGAPNLP